MAHFLIAVDPDPQRREQFAGSAAGKLADFPSLHTERFDCAPLVALAGRRKEAPFSHLIREDSFHLLLGYAISDEGKHLDAEAIGTALCQPESRKTFGGYFVAATFSNARGLTFASDLLGFFPVYYFQSADVMIVASSPELIAAHPNFRPELDLHGLTGMLLINSLTGDRPLLRGIRRLKPGHLLQWNAAGDFEEREVFSLRNLPCNNSISTAETAERSEAELRRAIRLHCPIGKKTALLLSGGLDSRLMAAYLDAEQVTDSAIGLGRPNDLETQVGRRVARQLGWNFQSEATEFTPTEFAAAAARMARWEQLAGGFSHIEGYCSGETVGNIAPMFWSGFALEDVLGGDAFLYGWESNSQRWSFDRLFSQLNMWGLTSEQLIRLINSPEIGNVIRDCHNELRAEYDRGTAEEPLRASLMKLFTRARYHVGSFLHRLALSSWPIVPILDRQLLETQIAVPSELKRNRRLQKELLFKSNPRLTAIPREHNSFLFEPIRPTLFSRKIASLQKRLRQWYWLKWRKEEPRRYVRLYDLNSPDWRAVRIEAEPHRSTLEQWMNRKMLDELWPAGGRTVSFKAPVSGSGASRLLLGLALWSKRD